MAASFMRLGRSLSGLYRKRPVLCNVCMYGTLYAASDVSQQTILRKPTYNWDNTKRIATVGGGFFGPWYYFWYNALEKMVPGRGAAVIVKKVVVDQCVAGVLGIIVFFTGIAILEGRPNIFEELKEKGVKTYFIGMAFWPAAQAVNFLLLPAHMRTVYVGLMAFCWTNILCYIKSLDTAKEPF